MSLYVIPNAINIAIHTHDMVVDDTHANAVEEHEHILEIHHDERRCLFILLSKLILYYNLNQYCCGSKIIKFLRDKPDLLSTCCRIQDSRDHVPYHLCARPT